MAFMQVRGIILSLLGLFTGFAQAERMATPATTASEVILVNKPDSAQDTRYDYPQKLLKIILAATEADYGPFEVRRIDNPMSRDRIFVEMKKGQDIHVIAEAIKPDWEAQLLPIRIPIRKGIQGFRIFLIKKQSQPILSAIRTLDELKKIPTGTSTQWSTTRALVEHGFHVVEGSDYEGLFSMLDKERFMTFGRGINEAFSELEARQDTYPDLAIEQDLLLYMPLPTYFFVTPHKPALAARIETGFQRIIENGTFERIFQEEFGEVIKAARLDKRRIFYISNPNLGPATPLNEQRYWYKPTAFHLPLDQAISDPSY